MALFSNFSVISITNFIAFLKARRNANMENHLILQLQIRTTLSDWLYQLGSRPRDSYLFRRTVKLSTTCFLCTGKSKFCKHAFIQPTVLQRYKYLCSTQSRAHHRRHIKIRQFIHMLPHLQFLTHNFRFMLITTHPTYCWIQNIQRFGQQPIQVKRSEFCVFMTHELPELAGFQQMQEGVRQHWACGEKWREPLVPHFPTSRSNNQN